MRDRTGPASPGHSRDDAVFAQLYAQCYRQIRNYCRRRVRTDLVDDAVAETFLTAWRRIGEVPAGDEALVWLYGVAYRVIGHQWRSATRRRRLEDRLRSVGHRSASAADDSLANHDEHRLVREAAARLSDTDAEVLRLATWEQLSHAEIAAVLNVDANAVKQRLHRARRHLAREYRQLESRQNSTPIAPTGGVR